MSDIDADHGERRGRQATTAVIVAVVFLAVLGASVGYLLGTSKRDQGNNVAAEQSATPTPAATPDGAGPDGGTNGGNNNGGNNNGGGNNRTRPPTGTKSYPPTKRDACPQQTAEGVGAGRGADLNLVLYIRTSRSEVWICQYQGRTVYQGHVRGRSFPSATSDHSILVTDVRYEAGVHAATNGSTTYYVSTERLRIVRGGQEEANEPVEDHHGG